MSAVKSSAEEIRHPFVTRGGHPHTAESGEHGRGGPNVVHDWTVRIHFKKYELGQSFAVLIFLGEVPDDASQWRTCPSFVGAHAAFVSSGAADRAPVAVERLPSLEVIVVQTTLTQEPGSVFPIAGKPQYHRHITYGRPGGARHAQA
ncbi:hypothetical protein BJV78DRAFT_1234936 [Lactifluus subvellereus]|nr:hypothetical protein BJV78DRAFT_1234936 [Lactifluus subvellereus]